MLNPKRYPFKQNSEAFLSLLKTFFKNNEKHSSDCSVSFQSSETKMMVGNYANKNFSGCAKH